MKNGISRRMLLAVIGAALAVAGCSRKSEADLAKVRPVMDAFLQAERDHRGSHGGYWRDSQPKVDRHNALKMIGVDIGAAPGFEFFIEPPESGYDPKLLITARGQGEASNVSLSCVLDAAAKEPECKETGAKTP